MKKIYCDFLIIGTGLAGLYSAIKASKFGKVALLSKSTLEFSNTYWAQGGIAAVIDPEDFPKYHIEDTLKAGRGLCDLKAVEILVNEGRKHVRDLISMGMEFDETKGNIALGLEGGHSKRRVLHAGGDATGLKLVEFLAGLVKENENIELFENTVVYELISQGKCCFGANAFNYMNSEYYTFIAKGTILATGGASGVYKRSTNPYTTTGDGIVLAHNIGAQICDMEFIQFHPSAFYSDSGETFLVSEAVRGEGAHLIDHEGQRFMTKYHEKAELAPRDVVSLAIYEELKHSGKENVFLSLSHLDPERIKKRFSTIYKEAKRFGLDLTKDPIPVTPAAHYTVGGVLSGYNAETNIERLFVCGEVAATGIHGANRLASNSLLECLVYGNRAVDAIADLSGIESEKASKIVGKKISIVPSNEDILIDVKTELSEIMNNFVGIAREEEGLEKALSEISELENKYTFDETENYSIKTRGLIIICKLITESALLRRDSIGGHFRKDFPTEPENKYHTVGDKKTNISKKYD